MTCRRRVSGANGSNSVRLAYALFYQYKLGKEGR
jgi:hypothetical protein